MPSLTLTVKTFRPTSALDGVPEMMPLVATFSQDGPLTFAKVSTAPASTSDAAVAMFWL